MIMQILKWMLIAGVSWFALCELLFGIAKLTSKVTKTWAVAFYGNIVKTVAICEGSWLPKLLRAWGTTHPPFVFLRDPLNPKGWFVGEYGGTQGPGRTQAWQMADELDNYRQYVKWGGLIWRLRAYFEPLIWWKHNSRPMEKEGIAHRNAIALGTFPAVQAPQLKDYDNYGMPT